MTTSIRGWAFMGFLVGFVVLGSAYELPAQLAKGRTLTGHGTFASEDGRSGQWRAEFVVDPRGQLRGNFRIDGQGADAPGGATGTADERRVSFAVVVETVERNATYHFEGAVLGTGVEGTFTDPRGGRGTWDGFFDDVDALHGPRNPAADASGPVVISN